MSNDRRPERLGKTGELTAAQPSVIQHPERGRIFSAHS